MNKTSENRRITLKVISYILVLAIALQFIVIHVSASDNISYICTSRVTLPPIRDKDWTNAEETLKPGNKLYWGCFHNQVRDYIAAKYGLETEMEIIYQEWQNKKNKKGEKVEKVRADLALWVNDMAYLWEIKPVHYGLNPVLEQEALYEQLGGYVNSNDKYRYGNESNLVFNKETFVSIDGMYTITYEDARNGLRQYRIING